MARLANIMNKSIRITHSHVPIRTVYKKVENTALAPRLSISNKKWLREKFHFKLSLIVNSQEKLSSRPEHYRGLYISIFLLSFWENTFWLKFSLALKTPSQEDVSLRCCFYWYLFLRSMVTWWNYYYFHHCYYNKKEKL